MPQAPASRTSIARVSDMDLNLSVQLVQAFIRRQEYRGSDVCLDVDAFPRATVNRHRWLWHEAHSYPFRVEEEHIILELRAITHTVEWRLRRMAINGVRFIRLSGGPGCGS